MPKPDQLPRREREILDAIVAADAPVSVDEIRGRLSAPPSNSAVRAMLARLETKGFVRHRAEGLRYVYVPAIAKTAARRDALQKVVRTFFGGSPGRTAAALLSDEAWSDSELDALTAEIARVRKGRRA